MSYTEVRDLFEKLKILGYPKPLKATALYTTQGSLENFKLVFDIMGWLVDQYEPGTQLEGGTATEIDRTLLVRSAVEFLAIKAGLKLSPMRLYSGSMAAAPELLKVVDLIMTRGRIDESTADIEHKLADIDVDDRIKARQRGRELSMNLTEVGASLYDLLGKEKNNQEKRNSQVVRQMESSNVEQVLRSVIASSTATMNADKSQLENFLKEKQAVSAKVERKKADLERLKQRLDTLQKIRPAYSEEFEKAEEELQDLFNEYFIHVRCLDALRAQMNANAKASQPVSEINSKSSVPPSMLLPDGVLDFEDDLSQEDDDDSKELKSKLRLGTSRDTEEIKTDSNVEADAGVSKLRIKTGVKREESRQIGSMLGDDDAESDLDSSLDFNGEDDSDDDSDLNVDNLMDDPAANVEALYNFSENVPARAKSAKTKAYQSDEDF